MSFVRPMETQMTNTSLFPHEQANACADAVTALQNLMVVSLAMPVWSGTKVMTPAELNAAGGTALPAELVTNSGKRVIDPKLLNPFSALRRKAQRMLGAIGVSFVGGAYAIPVAEADKTLQTLELIISEYEKERDRFLADYDANVESWIAQNPGYEELLRTGCLTKSEVSKKFGAYYTTLKLSTESERDRNRAGQVVDDLSSKALDEVSKDASDYAKGILNKSAISRRGIPRIQAIRDKLFGLGFLSNTITPVVQMIDSVLIKLPSEGELEGGMASEWKSLVMLLANRSMLQDFVDGLCTLQTATFNLPNAFLPPQKVAQKVDDCSLTLDLDEPKVQTEPSEMTSTRIDDDDEFHLDDISDVDVLEGQQNVDDEDDDFVDISHIVEQPSNTQAFTSFYF